MALDDAFIGEIRMFALPGCPTGWAPLDGRSFSQASYPWWPYLIGYGFGNSNGGVSLPDMRGRAPVGARTGVTAQGVAGGSETATVTAEQMPPHTHSIIAGVAGSVVAAGGKFFGPVQANGANAAFSIYGTGAPTTPLAAATIAATGGGADHENRQPVMAINFCVCLRGSYPIFDDSISISDDCLGEIRLFAFPDLPSNYLPCDGRLLPIPDYTDLYALIGGIFGGDGRSTFAIPNMSGRAPVGVGRAPGLSAYALGTAAGCETAEIGTWQMPAHAHGASVSAEAATKTAPIVGSTLASAAPNLLYEAAGSHLPGLDPLNVGSVGTAGETQAHPNIQPSLGLLFAICVRGDMPTFGQGA